MASRMDNWSVSDYLHHFEKEVERAAEARFKKKFAELAAELELLDSEFLKASKGCAKGIDPLIDQLYSLAGRLGYCEHPRGYEEECDKLYRDVDRAISSVRSFRDVCTT